LIYRARTSTTELVPTDGTWLGIIDDLSGHLQDATATVEPGDVVLLFTDGITEATNATQEMFGEDRLREALVRYADLGVDDIVQNIIRDVRAFMATQADDLTLVAMRREPRR
jgi:serine phosphatase RsbU (regulator of sigma subunit)